MNPDLVHDYKQQIQQHIVVHKLDWVDFVVYFPYMRLKITRVYPDYDFIKNMISEQKKIQQRVDEQIRELEDSFYEERF
jgi:hypothetical protein